MLEDHKSQRKAPEAHFEDFERQHDHLSIVKERLLGARSCTPDKVQFPHSVRRGAESI